MSSFLFPDVNVWLALSYERHIHHVAARIWLERLDASARVCFCRFTQLGLLRLLTTDAVMGEDGVLNQVEAWGIYDRWSEDARTVYLEEPATLELSFRALARSTRPAAKDWADSYLMAFATTAGVRLVTFDRALHARLGDALHLA